MNIQEFFDHIEDLRVAYLRRFGLKSQSFRDELLLAAVLSVRAQQRQIYKLLDERLPRRTEESGK